MKPVLYFAAVVAALCLFGPTPADAGLTPQAAPAACHREPPPAAPVYVAPPAPLAVPALAPCTHCTTYVPAATPAFAVPIAARTQVYRPARLRTWLENRPPKAPRTPRRLRVAVAVPVAPLLTYAPVAYQYQPAAYYTPAPIPAPAPLAAPCAPAELGEGY